VSSFTVHSRCEKANGSTRTCGRISEIGNTRYSIIFGALCLLDLRTSPDCAACTSVLTRHQHLASLCHSVQFRITRQPFVRTCLYLVTAHQLMSSSVFTIYPLFLVCSENHVILCQSLTSSFSYHWFRNHIHR
jgi:hypothetical protein